MGGRCLLPSTILGAVGTVLGIIGVVIVSNVFNEIDDILDPNLDPSPRPPAEAISEYGGNDRLDRLADLCAGSGTDAADSCSRLWSRSPFGSGYEAYGASCGDRPDRSGFTCLKD